MTKRFLEKGEKMIRNVNRGNIERKMVKTERFDFDKNQNFKSLIMNSLMSKLKTIKICFN